MRKVVIILLLIIFWPIGLVLMWSVQEFTRKTRYIVTAILTLGTILFTLYVYSKSKGEYYIPKPKALLKINLPDNNSALYSDKKLSFRYSKSAHVSTKKNTYSVNFLDYHSRIYFTINDLTDLETFGGSSSEFYDGEHIRSENGFKIIDHIFNSSLKISKAHTNAF